MSRGKDYHEQVAQAFGRTTDPLIEFDEQFQSLEVNPFNMWLEAEIYSQGLVEQTVKGLERHIDQWEEYVTSTHDRHPACPNTNQVIGFAENCLEVRENAPKTVEAKVGTLQRAFRYFGAEPAFPHPTDYNPAEAGRRRIDLSDDGPNDPRPIPLSELREALREIKHVRDRAMIVTQLKLGIRASEATNIKISELSISNAEIQKHYCKMGTHPSLEDRENAVYIPHDRPRNKSERPRVIPIDDELQRLLLQYLLCRPDNGEPWLFLSKDSGHQMDADNLNDTWKEYFRPEYGPTEHYRGVSSHYGRHYLATYFRVKREWPRPLLKYLRGDLQTGGDSFTTGRGSIDTYIHTYYEDIESKYREEIYKFRI